MTNYNEKYGFGPRTRDGREVVITSDQIIHMEGGYAFPIEAIVPHPNAQASQ